MFCVDERKEENSKFMDPETEEKNVDENENDTQKKKYKKTFYFNIRY